MSTEYFALKKSKDYVTSVMSSIGDWNQHVGMFNNNLAEVWARNIRYYYSNIFYGSGADSSMEFAGKQGELVKMIVPQARALNQQFLSLVTKQKLNFMPQSRNTDSKSLADTKMAKALCDKNVEEQQIDILRLKAAELCTLTGSAFYAVLWDTLKGAPKGINKNGGGILYEGGLDMDVYSVYDVQFNFFVENFPKNDQVVLRRIRNRWDLIAKHPDMRAELEKITSISKSMSYDLFWYNNMSEDYIFEYHSIHKSSPALPKGRYAVFCSEDTIMYDNDNPYEKNNGQRFIPIVQMRPEPIMGTGFGYPMFSNILPLQEMSDFCFSAAASNNAAFGVQSILNPIGNDIGVSNIGNLTFLNYRVLPDSSAGKPEPLQLTKSSPELYRFLELCRQYQMEIYNISGALRGQPPPGVTSGTAIATLATNSIEFAQNFMKADAQSLEMAMTMAMWVQKKFITTPQMIEIAGDKNQTIALEFTGSDLSTIDKVKIPIANPLLATAGGALEIANQLLDKGLIKNIRTYFQVLEGAPQEILYEKEYDQESLINKENDMMREGQNPPVLITDRHGHHVQEHLCLLDDPTVRMQDNLRSSIMAHVEQHMQQALQLGQNPVLQSMIETGQMPQGLPPMGMPPGGSPQGPPQQGRPQDKKEEVNPGAPPKSGKPANYSPVAKTLAPQVLNPGQPITG